MRLNPFFIPIALIVVFVGTTWVAQAAGVWSTSGRTLILPGTMTAADLKGWMTLQQVIDGLGLSNDEVYAAGKIPADIPTSTALKDLEKQVPGFETSTLRDALAAMPAGASAPAPSATPAAPIATVAPVPPTVVHTGAGAGPTPLPSGQVLAAKDIKGRMTLNDVAAQCAVPLDQLLAGLKLPPGTDPAVAIKDLIAQGKLADVTDMQKVVEGLQPK